MILWVAVKQVLNYAHPKFLLNFKKCLFELGTFKILYASCDNETIQT